MGPRRWSCSSGVLCEGEVSLWPVPLLGRGGWRERLLRGELPWSLGLATKVPQMRREASLMIVPEIGRASKNVCVAEWLLERQESSEAWEWAQSCEVRDVSPLDHLNHVQVMGAVELLIKSSLWNCFKACAWAQLIPFSISSGSLAPEGDQRKM